MWAHYTLPRRTRSPRAALDRTRSPRDNETVFELSTAALERVIFAMEDQAASYLIDLDSGEAVPRGPDAPANSAPPPAWSSRDGFQLMERFQTSLRNPALRAELAAVLGRGKGVFKAFKETLAAWPEAERSFRDYKTRVMKARVARWMDDLREAEGLERLGEPPEELDDLASAEFEVHAAPLPKSPAALADLVEEASQVGHDLLPAADNEHELALLLALLASGTSGHAAWIEDDSGGLIGGAFGIAESRAGRSVARIRFVYLREGYRRMGLGGALLDAVTAAFRAEGFERILLDSLLVPPEYGAALEARGYRPMGVRAVIPTRA